jgi:hypothetical protein
VTQRTNACARCCTIAGSCRSPTPRLDDRDGRIAAVQLRPEGDCHSVSWYAGVLESHVE